MKIFTSEYRHDYTTYTFGYTIYALFESGNDINELYSTGFLPYTGNLLLHHDLYYKSRGIRVDLAEFKDGSENRRVARKVLPLEINFDIIPKEKFTEWEKFFQFANEYSHERIGEKMPMERIKYITARGYLSHIIKFYSGNNTLGYILAVINEDIFHYWFAFFDTSYLEQKIPIGKWMMWKGIKIAQELHCKYAYLGNGYNTSSQYKTRDFNGIEFYDGNAWNKDVEELNQRCHADKEFKDLDLFKLLPDQNEWLKNHLIR